MQTSPSQTTEHDPTKFRTRSHEVSRIEAFSDVIFGFALTLLVVSLEVPHTFNELLADMRGFLPFAICFAIFAQVWWMHHNFFRRYGLDDALTATLNFILLFVMLLYVYPLKFLFTGMFNELTGHPYRGPGGETWLQMQQARTLMVIYGLGYATVFLIFILLHFHALRRREKLELNSYEIFDTRTSIMESAVQLFVGVFCAVTAVLLPRNLSGLAGYAFFLIPVGMATLGSLRGRARRRLVDSLMRDGAAS